MNIPRILKYTGLLAIGGGVGWTLMKTVTPSDGQLVKQLPEGSNSRTRNYARSEQQRVMDALKAAADNPDPIYIKPKRD